MSVLKVSRGRPLGDHAKKRRELLNHAIKLLVKNGYTGVSMRKLADAAKSSTGTITYYFSNKNELMEQIADELFNRSVNLIPTNRDFEIDEVLDGWISWATSNDGELWTAFVQLHAYSAHNDSFIQYAQQRYELFIEQLQQFILKGQKENKIRKDICARILAEQLNAMCDGFMLMISVYPQIISQNKVDRFKQALITLIRPTNTV